MSKRQEHYKDDKNSLEELLAISSKLRSEAADDDGSTLKEEHDKAVFMIIMTELTDIKEKIADMERFMTAGASKDKEQDTMAADFEKRLSKLEKIISDMKSNP